MNIIRKLKTSNDSGYPETVKKSSKAIQPSVKIVELYNNPHNNPIYILKDYEIREYSLRCRMLRLKENLNKEEQANS